LVESHAALRANVRFPADNVPMHWAGERAGAHPGRRHNRLGEMGLHYFEGLHHFSKLQFRLSLLVQVGREMQGADILSERRQVRLELLDPVRGNHAGC
jgi:hypothetical protein